MGGIGPNLRQTPEGADAGTGRGDGTARAPETRSGDPRRGTGHERVDDRPVASRGPRAGGRQEAPSGGCAIVGPQEHSGAHVLGLGRPAAGVRRGRPRRALRPGGERELRANAYCHRHRHRVDRVRAASVPRTDPAQGGAGRGPQAAAVRTPRFRHGQRQRFRERDGGAITAGIPGLFLPAAVRGTRTTRPLSSRRMARSSAASSATAASRAWKPRRRYRGSTRRRDCS